MDTFPSRKSSISRVPVTVELLNKGIAQCEIIRHLSPLSVVTILKALPIQDRVHKFADKFVYMESGVKIGREKQRTHFSQGDIAYLTSNGSICIFVKESIVTPMNPLGIVISNIELIRATQPGDIMILKKVE